MTYQPEIDFAQVVHTKENNAFSEAILFDQYERLSNNCKVIYNALKRGERLSGVVIVTRYGMTEYRRRIKDLRDAGVPIKEHKLENGCKDWYL